MKDFYRSNLAELLKALGVEPETGFFSNKAMAGAVALSAGLQMAVVYVEPLQGIFQTVALSGADLAVCFGVAGAVFAVVEIHKSLRRRC